MKYVVMLCDGMADYPAKELDGKTPMEAACKPTMNYLAANGRVGLLKTVADGLKPGSDVANLSCMGYDPMVCYTGRSPLEAASIGINLSDTDIAFRCNLVTLSEEDNYADRTMVDYCAGDISTAEADELIKAVSKELSTDDIKFYTGISYRHCMVASNREDNYGFLTPPHDISDKVIGEYLTKNEEILSLMKKSYEVLKDHPVNKRRIAEGKRPANSIWLWGQGKKPQLEDFKQKWGLNASVVSAVDLIKGIGKCANMHVCEVEGATGYIDTNFDGKFQAAVNELKRGQDFVYIHVEAPDECGHRGEVHNKVKAIELIDSKILTPLKKELDENYDDYRILCLPDHPTPLTIKTHVSDPVPFFIYRKSEDKANEPIVFSEKTAKDTGDYIDFGPSIMKEFLK